MPTLPVENVSIGSKLQEDVHTSLGGVLLQKGTVITDKEKELLQVFFIKEVTIEDIELAEDKQEKEEKPAKVPASPPISQSGESVMDREEFEFNYEKAVSSFKNLLINIRGGQNIPVLKVREVISPLLRSVQAQPNLLLGLRKASSVDSYTYDHSIAVGLLSYVIARWMKLPEKEWMQIALAGTLLDIGKMRIDSKLLWKPGKLTPKEFEEMKKHTVYGYQLIKASTGLNEGVAMAVLQHHEREDGSGYPLGLTGSQIHLYSKIVAVADVFHAMCSNRVYKEGASPYVVVEQLIHDSFGKLDPVIVHTFVNGMTQFSVGTVVELSDGSIAKIVFTDRNEPTRPMVEVNKQIVNLSETRHLFISRVL